MTEPIRLAVYGTPAPQGSKSAFVHNGKARVTEGGSKTGRESHVAWRQAVATAARDWQEAHNAPLRDEATVIEITFYLFRPRSIPKRRRYPTVKPDADKLIRSVLDALTGILISDDAKVTDIVARKRYAVGRAPGAVIVVGDPEDDVVLDQMEITA